MVCASRRISAAVMAPRLAPRSAARMAGEHRAAVNDAHLMRVGEHRQHATNIRMGYRIVIQIEADIGRFADANGNALEQRRRVVGQRQQARRFLDEHLADATFEVFGTASVGGLSIAPGLSLDIEIIKIGERASREERITYVTYGSLHAAFGLHRQLHPVMGYRRQRR
jgi:hypothetical protein